MIRRLSFTRGALASAVALFAASACLNPLPDDLPSNQELGGAADEAGGERGDLAPAATPGPESPNAGGAGVGDEDGEVVDFSGPPEDARDAGSEPSRPSTPEADAGVDPSGSPTLETDAGTDPSDPTQAADAGVPDAG